MATASLSVLSNELLYKICKFADCEDLKAFSATNRRLYSVAKPIVDKYRKLWAKLEHIGDGPDTAPWFWSHVARGVLSGDPPGTAFIRHVVISHDNHMSSGGSPQWGTGLTEDWDFVTNSVKQIPVASLEGERGLQRSSRSKPLPPPGLAAGTNDILMHAVESCHWLSETQRHDLRAGIREGDRDCILSLLLPQLPNLRTLRLDASATYGIRTSYDLLGVAARESAIGHAMNVLSCRPFGRLTCADFSEQPNPNYSPTVAQTSLLIYTLDYLAAFMGLPQMIKIAANSIKACAFTRAALLPPPKVTDITFLDSDIGPQAFENLIAGGAPLVALRIHLQNTSQYFDDALFSKVLLENARNSLEILEIRRVSNWGLPSNTGINLQEFCKLKDLTVFWESIKGDLESQMPPLADVLPFSLQNLTLCTLQHEPALVNHVLDLLAIKETTFPHLKELCLETWIGEQDKMLLIDACKTYGVVLKSYGISLEPVPTRDTPSLRNIVPLLKQIRLR